LSTNERNVSLLTTVLGAAAALVVVLTVGIFVQGWVLRLMAEEERGKIFDRPYPELEDYVQEQEQKLSGDYYWLDQEAGTVHLPIERAMALVVEEHGVGEQATEKPAVGEQSGVDPSLEESGEASP
jgi:hypothetical protein